MSKCIYPLPLRNAIGAVRHLRLSAGLISGSRHIALEAVLREGALKKLSYIRGHTVPHLRGRVAHALHRAVGVVVGVKDKDRLLPVDAHFVIGCEAGRSAAHALQRVMAEEQGEQMHREGISVRLRVGQLIAQHDLRRHIARDTEDAGVIAGIAGVVVVADEKLPGVGVEEEVRSVQVGIAEALVVQVAESVGHIYHGLHDDAVAFKMLYRNFKDILCWHHL